jgi:hypothetical protein
MMDLKNTVFLLDFVYSEQAFVNLRKRFCGDMTAMNVNASSGMVSAKSFIGKVKTRTWMIIGVVILSILGLLLWLLISVASWLLGQAGASVDLGGRLAGDALSQLEEFAPGVREPLESLVPDAKAQALALIEQAQNVVPDAKAQALALVEEAQNAVPDAKEQALALVEKTQNIVPELHDQAKQLVPNLKPVVTVPASDVSGNDIGPVARFPGLVRSAFAREASAVKVDYQGKAPLNVVVQHYVAGFVAAGFKHEVISADVSSELHKFTQDGSSISVSLKQLAAEGLHIQLVQEQ